MMVSSRVSLLLRSSHALGGDCYMCDVIYRLKVDGLTTYVWQNGVDLFWAELEHVAGC